MPAPDCAGMIRLLCGGFVPSTGPAAFVGAYSSGFQQIGGNES